MKINMVWSNRRKEIKKIYLNLPYYLPIPAVKGGATETLMSMLIEQNEIDQRVEFVIACAYDAEAEKIAKTYKHTKVIYFDKNKKSLTYSLFWRMNKLIHKDESINQSEYINYQFAKKNKCDLFIVEGFDCWPYQYLKRKYRPDRLWVHLHAELVPDQPMIDAFKKTIAISEFVKRRWLEPCPVGEHECKVVYNCVDEEKFERKESLTPKKKEALRKMLGFSKDDVILIYVGRIAPVKGVRELLAAVRKTENVKLLLIGRMREYDMDYVREIQDTVDAMGNMVKALGYIPNDELYQYYQIADIQVIPSMWEEAAGLVCIEGMYAGLPMIVTDSGGLVEYVTKECALIARRSDVINELAHRITVLRDNPELRKQMGEASVKRAKQFTKKRYYDDFLAALGV